MVKIGNVIAGLKPVFVMVAVQVIFAVVSILYKLVAEDEMSLSVFIAYRTLFASSFVVPLALFMDRKSRPKITSRVLFQAFLGGLFGATLQQNLFVRAIDLATATYATARFNLVPGVTFILSICFGLERLNIGTLTGKAKVIGTLTGVCGAMILTFFKSIEIHIWPTHVNLRHHLQPDGVPTNPIWGSVLAFGCCVTYSMWLIIQAWMSKQFPWRYTSVALISIMGSIQSVIFALCMERDWNQWKLGWNIRLIAILFSGIVASGVAFVLIEWCVRLKGPLYASSFNPLFLVLVAIVGSLALNERFYLGSILGSLLIVSGLYIVLWGKGKERKNIVELNLTRGSTEGEASDMITINQEDGKSGGNDTNDTESRIAKCKIQGIEISKNHTV